MTATTKSYCDGKRKRITASSEKCPQTSCAANKSRTVVVVVVVLAVVVCHCHVTQHLQLFVAVCRLLLIGWDTGPLSECALGSCIAFLFIYNRRLRQRFWMTVRLSFTAPWSFMVSPKFQWPHLFFISFKASIFHSISPFCYSSGSISQVLCEQRSWTLCGWIH